MRNNAPTWNFFNEESNQKQWRKTKTFHILANDASLTIMRWTSNNWISTQQLCIGCAMCIIISNKIWILYSFGSIRWLMRFIPLLDRVLFESLVPAMAGFKHSSMLLFLYPSKIRFLFKKCVRVCVFVSVYIFSIIINKNAAADWKTTRMKITERYNKWKKEDSFRGRGRESEKKSMHRQDIAYKMERDRTHINLFDSWLECEFVFQWARSVASLLFSLYFICFPCLLFGSSSIWISVHRKMFESSNICYT